MELLHYFTDPYGGYSTTEIILEAMAASLGILSVWYARKENILVYPTGLVSTGIYVYLLFQWQLYGDTIINAYYFTMSIVGWYIWTRKIDPDHYTPITRVNRRDWSYILLIFILTFIGILLIYRYKPYINSGFEAGSLNQEYMYTMVDYIDAFTTGTAFVAMWLMAKKRLEHWHFWIITDIVAIPLYFWFKNHGITGIQYIVFLIFAILGLFEWKNSLNNNRQIA